MNIEKIPVLGRIKKTMNVLIINFVLLAVICIIIGIVIPFYPMVLDLIAAAFLIVAAIIFLNIAFNIHSYKKKYLKWFDKFN